MGMIRRLARRPNLWIGMALLLANLFAWSEAIMGLTAPYLVDPVRDPEVVALLDHIHSGNHSGEAWEVTLTELEAEQTITWYLQRYPQIPFAHPKVDITPDHVQGEGDVTLSGLRVHVGAKVRVTLVEGLPVVEILELSLPLPGGIREAIEQEIQVQLQRAERLPVRFTSAEWRDGEVLVRGTIR
jgi:hypothetical protein